MYGLAAYERQQAKLDALRERFEREEYKIVSYDNNACVEIDGEDISWEATITGDGDISNLCIIDADASLAQRVQNLLENDTAYKKRLTDLLDFFWGEYLEREC